MCHSHELGTTEIVFAEHCTTALGAGLLTPPLMRTEGLQRLELGIETA